MNHQKINGKGRFHFWLDVDNEEHLIEYRDGETRITWSPLAQDLATVCGLLDLIDLNLKEAEQPPLTMDELRMLIWELAMMPDYVALRIQGYNDHRDVNIYG